VTRKVTFVGYQMTTTVRLCFAYMFVALLFVSVNAAAQYNIFAELKGSPVNTAGWSLTGAAKVGNVLGTDNSELILCPPTTFQSGGIFFNEPINLGVCSQWFCEFDMRMYDGTAADGIAFCFLDVPPSGYVNGSGLGIPGTANGLKVCFDTWNNCFPGTPQLNMPKIELRWGVGYNECNSLPTLDNSNGGISFIRSPNYNHVKIEYNKGDIKVFVNDSLYLTGNQAFNFTGYLGFTASTGGSTDMHSIKNVMIYANMPKSFAGTGNSFCQTGSTQVGGPATAGYSYLWTPSTGLNDPTIPNPLVNLSNYGTAPMLQKYYVTTSFTGTAGCTSKDSVTIAVYPKPSLQITTGSTTVCKGNTVTFTAITPNTITNDVFEWQVNNKVVATGEVYNTNTLVDGDKVQCILKPNSPCAPAFSNILIMTVSTPPKINLGIDTAFCPGGAVNLDGGAGFTSYQWSTAASSRAITAAFSSNYWVIGITAQGCESSDTIGITVYPKAAIPLDHSDYLCEGEQRTLNAGNYTTYQWNTGSTAGNIVATTTGTYSVTVTDNYGCSTTDSTMISSIIPLPSAFLPADTSICTYSILSIQSSKPYASYLWSSGESSQSIKGLPGKTYSLQVTDNYSCQGVDSIRINVKECPIVVNVPSAFTPNGDGRNDNFKPVVWGPVKKFHFVVYNRWGQKVFETNEVSKGWDGRNAQENSSTNVFVWWCEYEFEGEQTKVMKGTVTLIR
jgi:gliding motility-associated-like protein